MGKKMHSDGNLHARDPLALTATELRAMTRVSPVLRVHLGHQIKHGLTYD